MGASSDPTDPTDPRAQPMGNAADSEVFFCVGPCSCLDMDLWNPMELMENPIEIMVYNL